MAEFKAGDRVVKMSGTGAGKYGTVNSVMENGTLNVTFDGERLPKYCDPMRCGQVAANATKSRLKGFKVGDKVKDRHGNVGIVEKIQTDDAGPFGPPPSKYGDLLGIKIDGGRIGWLNETNAVLVNSRAANAAGFDNPNYDPAAGMKFLDTHFQMFDPKVAKAMIEDARRKGVKIPPGVIEKARRAGMISNAVRNAVALPSDSIRSESDLARAFAKKGWKLIMEGNRWTLRDDKGTIRWQASFGGDAESYDRVFGCFASYLNLR